MKKLIVFLNILILTINFTLELISQENLIKSGDEERIKKNYEKAKNKYLDALLIEKDSSVINQIKYKIGICLIYLNEDIEFAKFIEEYRKSNIGTVWEAKSYYLEGLFQARKYSYSQSAGAEAFDQARELYQKYYDNKLIDKNEIIQLNVLLVDKLEPLINRFYHYEDYDSVLTKIENIEKESIENKDSIYEKKWEVRKKIVFLYKELLKYFSSNKKKYYNILYDLGNYYRRVSKTNIYKKEYEKYFNDILLNSKDIELEAKTLYTLGLSKEDEQDFVKACEYYNQLIDKYKKSKWVNDAKNQIQNITKKELQISFLNQFYLKDTISGHLSVKNIKKVHFKLVQINFHDLIKTKINQKNFNISNLKNYLANIDEINKYTIRNIIEWDFNTSYKGDFKYVTDKIDIPDRIIDGKKGQYIIIASADNLISYNLIIVTDLMLITRTENDKNNIWVTSATSGEPINNANIINVFSQYDKKPIIIYSKTNNNGISTVDNLKNYSNFIAISYFNEDFAATNNFYISYYYKEYEKIQKYTITDRPIYRPGQIVYFKHIIKRYTDGIYLPLKNQKINVIIRDSRYQEVYKKELITNEFGSIADNYFLPDDAPLGLYNFSILVSDIDLYESYTQSFRVEEYKRPEFKVNIESITEKLKLGQNIKIKISANYYYGAPVSNGNVEYVIKRLRYKHSFYPVTPYDWLYKGNKAYRHPYWWYYDRKEELVESNTNKLNEEGFIILNYETESLLGEDWNYDYEYIVEAKVYDDSRRIIEEEKSIIVPRKEFNAYIKNERGYLSTNENTKFSIHCLTNNNVFRDSKGEILIYKLKFSNENKSIDTLLIKREPIYISKNKNFYSAKFIESGKYKIEFITYDVDSEKISADLYFYVIDQYFSNKSIFFDKFELITDKDSYSEGDTMKLLINSEIESPTIWLSFEADNKIFEDKVIKIKGRSELIYYSITKKDVPNLFITGFLVHDSKIFKEETQVMIPPEKQIISIDISTNKNNYEPKEKVILKIKTLDYKGEPVKAEVTLSIYDASLLYIQEVMVQNIKKYFYGSLRSNLIKSYFSKDIYINGINEDNNKYVKYNLVGLPDGYYRISKFLRYFTDLEFFTEGKNGKILYSPELQKSAKSANEDFGRIAPKGEGELTLQSTSIEYDKEKIDVREKFDESLYWNPFIETNSKGEAEITFYTNDALTQWTIDAKAITIGSEVGEKVSDFTTSKKLIVRLQTPRFLQEKDEVIISAIINNYSGKQINTNIKIEYNSEYLTLLNNNQNNIKIILNKENRIDWRFRVNKKGKAEITVFAESRDLKDAMKITLPIFEYGSKKQVVVNGELISKEDTILNISIPKDIRPYSQSLEISLNPSIATIALSALPYLIDYPYGCFEQTLNRFIPLIIVYNTLKELNIDLYEIQEFNQKINKNYLGDLIKIYDRKEINKLINKELKKIYEFQNSNGGFSWWKGEESDLYMTALGISSLIKAKQMGINVDSKIIDFAVKYTVNEIERKETIDLNQKAYMIYAISCWDPSKINQKIIEELYKLRDHLSYYSISLLGLANMNIVLNDLGLFNRDRAIKIDIDNPLINNNIKNNNFLMMKILLENLLDRIKIDSSNLTAYWNPESKNYWRWYNHRIETTGMILKFINSINPKYENLSKIVRWLVNNRKGNIWYSTKDTGLLIEILMEYLKVQKELEVDCKYEVLIDNKKVKEISIDKNNMFTFNNIIKIDDISVGNHKIKILKKGKGNLYFSLKLDYFTREDSIIPAGNEIFVQREYFKLNKKIIKTEDGSKIQYEEIPLKNMDTLVSGDEIKVKLTIDSKNDYEYFIFEDRKPSGMEYKFLKSWGGYMEFRDEKVVFFRNYLSQGTTIIEYNMRAETPGNFYTMPTLGYAMYMPDVYCNSSSIKINISNK